MKSISGIPQESFPYPNLEFVSNLFEYDGPILTHYKNKDRNKEVLFYWVDNNENFNRWLVFEVTRIELLNFLTKKVDLRQLVQASERGFIFLVDTNDAIKFDKILMVSSEVLPEDYLPVEQFYFPFGVPEIYDNYFADNLRHYFKLINEALFIKISPTDYNYQSIVTLNQTQKLIENLQLSFTSFVRVDFSKKFKNSLRYENWNKLINSTVDSYQMRLVHAKQSSFEIGIVVDTVMAGTQHKEVSKWGKTIVKEFENEVIKVDYNKPERIEYIMEKYDSDERLKIFKPIIDLINDETIELTLSDSSRIKPMVFKKVKKNIVDSLFKREVIALAEPVQVEKEIRTLIYESYKGEDDKKITIGRLKEQTLFDAHSEEVDLKLDYLAIENYLLYLIEPINYKYRVKGSYCYASIPELEIEAKGKDRKSVIETLSQIYFGWLLMNSPDDEIEKAVYFDSIIKLIANQENIKQDITWKDIFGGEPRGEMKLIE